MIFTSPAPLRKFVVSAAGLLAAAAAHSQTESLMLAQANQTQVPASASKRWSPGLESAPSDATQRGSTDSGLVPATAAAHWSQDQLDELGVKRWSVSVGWNRSKYSNSTMHFTGGGYDFTLQDVAATDGQAISSSLSDLIKPQNNLRLAYQWTSNTAVAVNLDHMKYVVTPDQSVAISGTYGGSARSGQQTLSDSFINYKLDGLNILSVELEQQRKVDWTGGKNEKIFGLVDAGLVVPNSVVTMSMVGQTLSQQFHPAGWSVGAGVGFQVDIWKDVFVRTAFKSGYVSLLNAATTNGGDTVAQSFTYAEALVAVGMRF